MREGARPPRSRWWWDLASLLFFTAPAVVAPVLPLVVEEDLGAGSVVIGASVAAIGLPGLVTRPVAGWLADRWGARRLFLLAATGAGLAIVGSGLASVLGVAGLFVLLRLAQGVGDGAVFSAAATAAGESVAPHLRGRSFTRFALTLTAGLVIGPFIAEPVAGLWGRQAVFWVAGGLAALAVGVLTVGVPATRSPASAPRADDAGDGADSTPTARLATMVHLPAVVPGVALGMANLGFAALFGFVVLVGLDRGMGSAGLLISAFAATLTVVRGLLARLPDRIGLGPTIVGSALFSAAGMFGIAVAPSAPGLVAATVCFGMGAALLMPAVLAASSVVHVEAGAGVVLGTVSGVLDVSIGAGALVLGVVAAAWGDAAPFVVCGTTALLSLPVFAWWRSHHPLPVLTAGPILEPGGAA
jgi:MFS family permease